VSEEELLEAISRGHDAVRKIVAVEKELAAEIGKTRRSVKAQAEPAGLREKLLGAFRDRLADAMRTPASSRATRRWTPQGGAARGVQRGAEGREGIRVAHVGRDAGPDPPDEVLVKGIRLDGRRFDQIREIRSEVSVLPAPTGRRCSRGARRRPS